MSGYNMLLYTIERNPKADVVQRMFADGISRQLLSTIESAIKNEKYATLELLFDHINVPKALSMKERIVYWTLFGEQHANEQKDAFRSDGTGSV